MNRVVLEEIAPGDRNPHHMINVHRIFCIDCSYSMCSTLPDIQTQLCNKIASVLRPDDFMTLIWFSGKSSFGTIFEHYSVKSVQDLANIQASIRQYLKPVGSTGFVEPILLAKSMVDKYPENIPQIYFLTDGCENSWSHDECKDAFQQLNNVPTVLVEYGYSCDRNFIQLLAEQCNGTVIFNEDFSSFQESFETYLQNHVAIQSQQIHTDLPIVFIDPVNGEVVIKKPLNGVVRLANDVQDAWFYQPSRVVLETDDTKTLYVELSVAIHERHHDHVKVLLRALGDKYITRLYSSTYSKQDYSRLLEHINGCIHHPDQFANREGVDHEYFPPEDAFNVLELLQILENDSRARFYPYHDNFKYLRISRPVNQNDAKTRFLPNKSLGSPIHLIYHSSRANVSLQCVVLGHTITDDDTIHADSSFRNFTVIKDGIKHVSALPVSVSEVTFLKLQSEGCISSDVVYERGAMYTIDLTHLPVVNRKFVLESGVSFEQFVRHHIRLLYLKTSQKYLKKQIEMLEVDDGKDDSKEEKYDREHKHRDDQVRDFYTAPELQVKIAKCSTIPAVNDKLLSKLENGSKLTLSESIFVPIHQQFQQVEDVSRLVWCKQQLSQIKSEIQQIQGVTEQAKMAFLIGGPEFVADNSTLTVEHEDGNSFCVTVEIHETKVYLD